MFEDAQLQDIRGASALLDRINLIDIPALFHGEDGSGEEEHHRFRQCLAARSYCQSVRMWAGESLSEALISDLIVYSTGGNVLAFCPESLVEDIANAIEKRYTHETLTANSCVVGDRFSPLELFLGLLKPKLEETLWLDDVLQNRNNPAAQAYFELPKNASDEGITETFRQRKNFNELVGKLANQFNQRRSGWNPSESNRPTRRYPPMFETHPYLMRDDGDRRSLVLELSPTSVLAMNPEQVDEKLKVEEILPDNPKFSEPSARKRWIGQVTKRENSRWRAWYRKTEFLEHWNPIQVLDDELKALGIELKTKDDLQKREDLFRVGLSSWVNRFEQFLLENDMIDDYDSQHKIFGSARSEDDGRPSILDYYTREARSLTEIGAASSGFVAYIYADGNNMGQYIRDKISTPEEYQQFSKDVFEATEQAVYHALAQHIRPYRYTPDARSSRDNKGPVWIHPFEIITIGGDDVLLIVPANKGLEIAEVIGRKFEEILLSPERNDRYRLTQEDIEEAIALPATDADNHSDRDTSSIHRYRNAAAESSSCRLSISSGVLITAENTPIYYADKLVSQLLKSAKKKAKALKKKGYFGGTVDFLTLKAVTMISSNIKSFREEGLTKQFPNRLSDHFPNQQCELNLQLYAAPYTLHELGGLIKTVRSLQTTKFPKSQLYQVRSLLEQGKQTAMLNYRYFRVRLDKDKQELVEERFEESWCKPETNNGNLAPWLSPTYKEAQKESEQPKVIYSTIWREIVDLLPFITELSTSEADRERSRLEQEVSS